MSQAPLKCVSGVSVTTVPILSDGDEQGCWQTSGPPAAFTNTHWEAILDILQLARHNNEEYFLIRNSGSFVFV